MSDRSTGARAAQLVREAAGTAHGALMAQLRKLGIKKNTFFAWESGETTPSLYTLQAMALHGYDVLYILIGRRGASNREYQTGGGQAGMKTDTSFCADCIYYGSSTRTCDYIFIADRRRPCPAGEGCTVKITRKEQNMAKATWDTAKGYQMFLDGESDAAIAKAVGIASSTLNYYKRKHWLPQDPVVGGDAPKEKEVVPMQPEAKKQPEAQPVVQTDPMDMFSVMEAATGELKGIQAICTANAIQSLWNWKSIYDLQRARASIDYLLKKLGE